MKAVDKNNIEYVPTITNKSNKVVFIGLPENVSREDKTDEELQEILLKNIFNQL